MLRSRSDAWRTRVVRSTLVSTLVLAASAAALSAGSSAGSSAAQSKPTLDDVLERAHQYVASYGADLTAVVGVERYEQAVRSADMAGPATQGLRPWSRKTVAEFALVRLRTDWVGYRDVIEVDGKSIADRRDRLQQLFRENASTAADQARRIADESARYNAGSLQRNFNVPTMALLFLQPANATRVKFKQDGTDKIDGTPVWKVKFEETGRPTVVRGPDNSDVPVHGRFWIDPLTGRVLKSFMEIVMETRVGGMPNTDPRVMGQSDTPARALETYSRVTTTYRQDSRLDMLVPSEMTEEHQGLVAVAQVGQERMTVITCKATYADFKKFETAGRLIAK